MIKKRFYNIIFLMTLLLVLTSCGQKETIDTDKYIENDTTVEVSREEYIKDPDKFQCVWESDFDVPDWMTDYEEKQAAFRDTDGRIMSAIHKADSVYYPENSIEAIISAVKMGADIIEMDLCLTKDDVLVLMHSTILTSTTDWASKRGNSGLPLSEKIEDWTYEELCNLNLCMADGTETDYKIPTFEEALQVCKGRTKIILDKDAKWNWNKNVYPLIQKYEAWDTCIIPRTYDFERQAEIVQVIEQESDVTDVWGFAMLSKSGAANWESDVQTWKHTELNIIGYWAAKSVLKIDVDTIDNYLKEIAGEIRILGQSHASGGGIESPEQWDYMHENGINIVLVDDDGLSLQKYIAENYEPTDY